MSFGAGTNLSRSYNHNVEIAKKVNGHGDVTGLFSHGGMQTKQEEYYSSSFTNAAVNGQQGTSAVQDHNLIEVNTDWSKEQKTTVTCLSTSAGLTTA
jgi:hypothetical protein